MDYMGNLGNFDEPDPYFMMESIRLQQEVSPSTIAGILFRLCEPKSKTPEEYLANLSNFAVEKLIIESPLTEIFKAFDSSEMGKKFCQVLHFDFQRFLMFCRFMCSSEKQGYDIIGMTFFSKAWKNNAFFQCEFIKHCIASDSIQPILNSCTHATLTRKVPMVDTFKCSAEYETDHQIYCWKYLCLCQVLLELSENQLLYSYLEELFFVALNKCPDLLVFALLETQGMYRLKETVLVKALSRIIYTPPNNPNANPNATQVIQRIWPPDFVLANKSTLSMPQKALLTSMLELYSMSSLEEQPLKLSRILDLSQDLKVLNLLLSSQNELFVIDLAYVASKREYLKLDKWLNDKIQHNGQPFVEVCLNFLRKHLETRPATFGPADSPNENYGTVISCLRQYVSDKPKTPTEIEIIKMFNKYNQLMSHNQMPLNAMKTNPFDPVNSQPFGENPVRSPQQGPQMVNNYIVEFDQEYSKEIEEEADSYFQRIYNQDQPDSLSIDQVLEMLKRFQESTNKREKDVSQCMIRNLFKEYPFLHQYPDKELIITGEIFGGIILNDNVKGYHMVGALRYVLEALKQPINSRYFTFGQAALNKLKSRLKEFPQFCNHLCNIPNYRDLQPHLIEYVEYGKQNLDPPLKKVSNAGYKTPSVTPNSESQLSVPEVIPPNPFQDKIAFIINNLSMINLAKKAEEFKELFSKEKDQYYHWFSQYFIMKRVSLEANFHEVYATFLVKLFLPEMSKLILQETYRNIKIILRTNKETDNFSDRTLLKNLGQWLGLLTLAQNKPVLSIDLDLRNLLVEAYHKGLQQLLYVVPFVAKVLSGCAKSRVFKPPNPWTVQLIAMLVELHCEQDLKLNLKFEVEVLCKNLDIDLTFYIGKTNILKNKELFAKIDHQLGFSSAPSMPNLLASISDASSIVSMASHQPSQFELNSLAPPITPNSMSSTLTSSQSYEMTTSSTVTNISSLSQSIHIQPNLQIVMMTPGYKNLIKTMIEKCVQDWINFIADRVIKVCLVTTETLVKKDFTHEANSELMRSAAHKMMKRLVSGYSLINTEEPLTSRLQISLQSLFATKASQLSKELIDSTINTLVMDNIELCVCFVQKICIERGIEELDKKMKPDFELRQNCKSEERKKGLITVKQMAVYEEMGRNIPGYNATGTSTAMGPYAMTEGLKTTNIPVASSTPNYNLLQNEHSGTNVQVNQTMDQIVFIYDKLIKHLSELIGEFEYVHCSTEAMHQVLEILRVAKHQPREQSTAVTLIKNVINGLRELILNSEAGVTDFNVIQRARDFYLLLLKALTDQRAFNLRFTTTNITRFVMEHWITMNQNFPDDLFDTLYRSSLINLTYMDQEFFQLLENGQNTIAINIILNFLKYYLNTGINASCFSNTLELLQRIAVKVNQSNHPLLNELKNILTIARMNVPGTEIGTMDPNLLVDKFDNIIKEWIVCFTSNKNINNSLSIVVKSMNAQGLLKNDELISRFFKTFLETVVDRCYQVVNVAQQHPSLTLSDVHSKCYEFIDAFSTLVLLFIKQSGNQGNVEQKFQFLNRILTILATTATKDQEMHQNEFYSLPYYRILLFIFVEFFYSPYNLGMQEIMNHDNFFEAFKWHLVRNYCNVLHVMSPLKLPSFTFAWLDFISHRVFIGKCLDNTPQVNYKTWQAYFILINDLLTFQKPILQNFELVAVSNTELYKGTLKLFLLLFHDFPEFICEYCYNLCDLIPIKAVQLRNIVLSAFPLNFALPEISNLKLDNLHEALQGHVRLGNNSLYDLLPFKKELDNYLVSRIPVNFLTDFSGFLHDGLSQEKQTSVFNALTLYLSTHALQTIKTITTTSVANSSCMEVFRTLLLNFDSQARYQMINSLVDHLRFPNTETLFFICLLLDLFKDTNEHIREQIVRVLLERIIARRPHPWGIVYIVNELIRNPSYKLLEHNFIKCVPEVENILTKFFQGVMNSMGFVSNSINCNDTLLIDSR